MFDARIFLNEIDTARKILNDNQALFKGDYVIHDAIYASKDPLVGIDKVFLRLRSVPKNIWPEKPFIVAVKLTELKQIGKQSIIPVKKFFDSKNEAEQFIQNTYADQFDFLYEFDRNGWQYDLGQDQIDLEYIEGHYSIEFKSPTEVGLQKLLALFNARDIIQGPSVVAIRDLLIQKRK